MPRRKKWSHIRFYDTPEGMIPYINEYFEECDTHTKKVIDQNGVETVVPDPLPYTVSGLCDALSLDPAHFSQYQALPEYQSLLELARQKILRQMEERLLQGKGSTTGMVFLMKNRFGWRDSFQHEIGGQGGGPVVIRVVYGDQEDQGDTNGDRPTHSS